MLLSTHLPVLVASTLLILCTSAAPGHEAGGARGRIVTDMTKPPSMAAGPDTAQLDTTQPNAPLDRRIVAGSPVRKAADVLSVVSVSTHAQGFIGCAGVIVSPLVVITAASCTLGPGMYVRAGSVEQAKGGAVFEVKRFTRHPDWNPKSMQFDVAVLQMAKHFPVTRFGSLRAATLVPSDIKLSVGQKLTVAGWGATSQRASSSRAMMSPVLQQVVLPVINSIECSREDGRISPRQFCTQATPSLFKKTKGVCYGDTGAPLFDAKKKVLVGGVSYAVGGCANPKSIGAHTNYADPVIHKWIKEQIDIADDSTT